MSESLSTRQKVALCAALGAGAVVGATGLVVYQRLSQNVGLKVRILDSDWSILTKYYISSDWSILSEYCHLIG